jgi:hypothetical protein
MYSIMEINYVYDIENRSDSVTSYKISNIKFRQNPSTDSESGLCGRQRGTIFVACTSRKEYVTIGGRNVVLCLPGLTVAVLSFVALLFMFAEDKTMALYA